MKKRITSLVLVLVMLLTAIPFSAFTVSAATEYTEPTFVVQSVYAEVGSTVDVKVDVKNNPGIAGATLNIDYDSNLTLIGATNGDAFSDLTLTLPGSFTNPSKFLWDSLSGEVSADDTILILKFRVSEDAEENSNLDVNVSYQQGDIYNEDMEEVSFQTVNGCVTVINYIPGDVNDDGIINGKDVTLARRHVVGGYEQTIVEEAADVNADGRINGMDVTLIRRHIVEGTELKPAPVKCDHKMTFTEYKAATCEVDGNIAYWHCSACNKYFSDEKGTTEITLENTVIKSPGHTVVVDEAVAPTYITTGLTEGSHCSVCDYVIKKQEVIPALKLDKYAVTYNIASSDNYLAGLDIKNENPSEYTSQEGLVLRDLMVAGYNFKGWYTAQTGGTRVTEIPAGSTGEKVLYAQWEKVEYTVTFDSPDVPWENVKYTVDKGVTLSNPSWFGYTFVGWSMDGNIVSSIKPGTTGNITLHANWTSNRNKAKAVGELAAPNVIEDMDRGQYLFVYEIGTIENVPLSQIEYIGNSKGININKSFTYSHTVNQGYADTIAKAVSNATTKTSSWTLSEDWNKTTSATNERDEQIGKTESKTDSEGNVIGSKYYVSNSSGGATSSSSSGGGSKATSSKVTEGTSTGINGSYTSGSEQGSSVNLHADAKLSASMQVGPAAARTTMSGEISAGVATEQTKTDHESATRSNSRTDNIGTENLTDESSHWESSSSSSSTWNSTNSYENSSSTSRNTEISKAISEVITNRYAYTSSESSGGSNSSTTSTGESQELTDEYASTIEYSTEQSESITKTITYTSDATGFYRLVTAGTVHVFAVVGYDIATNSYFTYTYNVLDKERHEYLDYSKDNANFNDCENAILPFEVPYFVHEYISEVIARSSGLTVDTETGIITEYVGNADNIIIPEYVSVNNGDGTFSAVRIRGFSSDAFRGNTDIKAIYLPKYVYEIPNGAFEGCTSLETVIGYGIAKIGTNAFKGCTSLKSFTLDEYVTSLGNNAFDGVKELTVMVANSNVADATINSGAKRITLNLSKMEGSYDNKKIVVTDKIEYFALISNGATYSNLQVESDAEGTFISNITFIDNVDTPLKLSSSKVNLSRVSVVNAPGFALVLTAEDTELYLFGTIGLSSSSGNAVISKNVRLDKANVEVAGKLQLTGNYLVSGELSNSKMLGFNSGRIVEITEDEFNTYLTSSLVNFDPNGGAVPETSKVVYYGQKYGALPIPTKDNYDFSGWFTAKTDGTEITEDMSVTTLVNQTLYAQWTPKKFTVTYNVNGDGATVSKEYETLSFGDSYSLPTPTRDYYTFDGWYSQALDGEKVTASTEITEAKDVTLYAHWTQNPVSGWVKASAVPTGAQIVDTKWSYTLREYKTSSSSSLSGYTKYDTKRSSWGSTKGPVYSDPSNGSRNVWSESYEVSRTHYYHYYRYKNSSGTSGSDTKWGNYTTYESVDLTYKLTEKGASGSTQGYKWYYNGANYHTMWLEYEWDDVKKGTRWYYQEPVYTYYYYRDLSKESTSDPTGQSNVSNVVKYVQYRAK